MPLLWDTLSQENKEKLRSLMPEDWQPPGSKGEKVRVEGQMESLEEIDRLMRIPSKYPKGFYSHG